MDVSDRIVFEENKIICTEHGVVPHGNSISAYDARTNPSSRWWSFTRNNLSRPAYTKGTEQNWNQRESLTTDGSGTVQTTKQMNKPTKELYDTTTPFACTLLLVDTQGVCVCCVCVILCLSVCLSVCLSARACVCACMCTLTHGRLC